MATQLKMFEGVQGNRLGVKAFGDESGSQQPTLPEAIGPDDLLCGSRSALNLVDPPKAMERPKPLNQQPKPDVLLPPRAISTQQVAPSQVSLDNPNPYDPASNSTAWAQIRAFFLRGFQE